MCITPNNGKDNNTGNEIQSLKNNINTIVHIIINIIK